MTAKELREKRAALKPDMDRLRDQANEDGREWTSADEENWAAVNADWDRLTRQIEMSERVDAATAELASPVDGPVNVRTDVPLEAVRRQAAATDAPTEEHRCLAMAAWVRTQSGDTPTEAQEEACRLLNFNPNRRELRFDLTDTRRQKPAAEQFRTLHPNLARGRASEVLREQRDLSAITGSTGAFTIPEGFVNALEINMLAFGGMLQVADVLRTESGNSLPWPTFDDTSNTGEQLGESTTIGSSVDPTFAQVVFEAYKFSSKLIKVPSELLEDAAFDLPGVIGAALGERLGRISNTKFTTGTGAGTPKGLMVAATLGKTTADATAIVANELFDLVHSVDPAYRTDARFMFHDAIFKMLRLLKDTEGRYLWQDGLTSGVPNTLLGYPITVNQDMASAVTTGQKTMAFGQLNKYKIRQVRSVRFFRMVERYRDTDQDGFVAFIRQDGNLLDAGTAPVKYMQQA